MKKLLIGASLLALTVTGVMAQAPTKELTFAVLKDKTGAQVAEITVSSTGLNFKVTGYETLTLTFDDVRLLEKASGVYNQ